jgi:NAD(P)-dependent dehydrogenase (short-subunit alcohol dehydrogenase family)
LIIFAEAMGANSLNSVRGLAVITGAGGGVGGAGARRFARTHRLLLIDVDEERVERAAAPLRAEGRVVETMACDLADGEAARALADRAGELGPLRVLVNAAGLSPSMADAWRILEVNLLGTVAVVDALAAHVTHGTVGICIASISGWRRGIWRFDEILRDPLAPDFRGRLKAETEIDGYPGRGYALSKRGVILLVERRAHDWGSRGGRLVSVSPGLIEDTDMGKLEAPKGGSGLIAMSALGRGGTSDDIAGVCAMLASPDASYVTGVDLRVDGGSIAGYWHHSDPATAAAWDQPGY